MRLVAFVTASLFLACVACVGDTPTTTSDGGPAAGEEGGPCYTDGTCNKTRPLVCLSKLCVRLEGDASVTDGGTSDATPDAPATCPFTPKAAPSVRCVGGNPCTQNCCVSNGVAVCQSTSCTGNLSLACDDSADCPSASCCLTVTSMTVGCPVTLSVEQSQCASSCGTGSLQMCASDEKCPTGKTCVKASLTNTDFGVCL